MKKKSISFSINLSKIKKNNVLYTGGAKSQNPYVGLNNSVTECPIEIILFGMTYYYHCTLVQGIRQIETYLCSFFSNEGSFSHLFDSLDSGIEPNFSELCLAI